MINKIKSIMILFKRGKAVADPGKWKARQITSTTIVGLIYAAIGVADAFGYQISIDQGTVDGLAVGILTVVNIVFTLTTSKKIGL